VAKRSAKVSIAGLVLPVRLWTQRFAFLGLVLLSLTLMLLSRAELSSINQVRLAIVDLIAPVIFVFSKPVQAIEGVVSNVERLFIINQENQNLRENNARLIQWVEEARRLNIENATLRAQLEYVPDKRSQFVTARIVADTGGVFFHSLLINAGARQFVRRGQAVIWQGGLIGRIAEVGNRTSRVLLMIDINSHIPVVVESTGDRAILAGNNTSRPVLEFLPGNSPISRGDRIVTSGHGGVYPPGLIVGNVAQATHSVVSVKPFVDWSKLNQAVILDYGVDGILPAPERVPTRTLQNKIPPDLKTTQ
jgi:rod shape-determining protein MreC|tara:strand:+ start:6176 stop:7093 length:918 start_codon:yes stop_codon:yes gene_type:complete